MKAVIVIIVVLVILALAAAIFVILQNRRRAQLQDRFGPEYDRAVGEAPSRREAEQHLAGIAQRRQELTIRDLNDAERARYSADWEAVQAQFVDQPGAAVDAAEALITTVMRERGYPADDFDEQADLVAADHPEVVQHYREAHAAHQRHRSTGGIDTEDLRQSFVHYRALFAVLTEKPGDGDPVDTTSTPVEADTPVDAVEPAPLNPPTSHPQETR